MSREDASEGFAELRVEDGVYDWVERRVGISQPREDFEYEPRDACLAECGHYINAKEGHPADEKDAHDYSYGDGCLVVGYVVR